MGHMVTQILAAVKSNPILAGAVGLYGATVATFLLRMVPARVFEFLGRHLTTTLTVANAHSSYYQLMAMLEEEHVVNKLRTIRFQNGMWGDDGRITKSVGLGRHLFLYHGHIMFAEVDEASSNDRKDKLTLKLRKLGRSHALFDKLKVDLEKMSETPTGVTVYYSYSDFWYPAMRNPERPLESIILPEEKRDLLLSTVQTFLDSESWYSEHGIPYQLGILLYGPPGTGKTSVAKALASHFKLGICSLSIGQLGKLQDAVSKLPQHSLLVVEDIDSELSIHRRQEKSASSGSATIAPNISSSEEPSIAPLLRGSLKMSDVLNSIDGLLHKHGRIMVFTTNHLEKLDDAFLRPGRVDLKLEIGYIGLREFRTFLRHFFPERLEAISARSADWDSVADGLTVAQLQNDFMLGYTLENIIDRYIVEGFHGRNAEGYQ